MKKTRTLGLLGAILVLGCASVEDDWDPSPLQWEFALYTKFEQTLTSNLQSKFGWPDTVCASRDFLITDHNHWASIYSWRFDTALFVLADIGELSRPDHITSREVRVQDYVHHIGSDEYDSLKAHDSLWTLISDEQFWEKDHNRWRQVIKDRFWMYNKYHQESPWLEHQSFETHDHMIPQQRYVWEFELNAIALNWSQHDYGPFASVSAGRVTVDYVDYFQDHLIALVTRRGSTGWWRQVIVGKHFRDSLVYVNLYDHPVKLTSDQMANYESLRKADSLWSIVSLNQVVGVAEQLPHIFDSLGHTPFDTVHVQYLSGPKMQELWLNHQATGY